MVSAAGLSDHRSVQLIRGYLGPCPKIGKHHVLSAAGIIAQWLQMLVLLTLSFPQCTMFTTHSTTHHKIRSIMATNRGEQLQYQVLLHCKQAHKLFSALESDLLFSVKFTALYF